MNENILIAVAWPYANAEIHVGISRAHIYPVTLSHAITACKGTKC
jgi:methionyl-tRNA synthetase